MFQNAVEIDIIIIRYFLILFSSINNLLITKLIQTLTTNSTFVFTFMISIMSDEHRPGGYGFAAIFPIANNRVLMCFHMSVQLFPIIKLFNAFLALECKSMSDKVRQNITLRFITFFTNLQLIRM